VRIFLFLRIHFLTFFRPDDAKGMSVRKSVKTDSGATTTTYTITYQLKEGGTREVVKEYEGKK